MKYGDTNIVEVSTDGCNNLDDFIMAVKKELSPDLDSVSVVRISISLQVGGVALDPGAVVPAPIKYEEDGFQLDPAFSLRDGI